MILRRYRVTKELEKGASSVVLLCDDTETGALVVLKQISKGYYTRQDFEKEVAINADVANANIVSMLGHFVTEDCFYILFEPGETDLLAVIQKQGPMPEPKVRSVFKGLSVALAVVHSRGVVHNDVKLENMIVMPDGRVKLTDFGLAERLIGDRTLVGRKGTFRYWSPEIVAKKPHDQKADIWALGVCMFIALTGAFPFGDGSEYDYTMRVVMGRIDLKMLDSVGADLRELVTSMLNKDAGARPSAQDIAGFEW